MNPLSPMSSMSSTSPMRSLCALLLEPPAPALSHRPVARRQGRLLDAAAFRHQALCWAAAFQAVPGPRVALFFEDTLDFATALFGAWRAGKTAVLPGELTPAMLQALAGEVQGLATDQPVAEGGDAAVLRIHPASLPAPAPAEPLDPEQPWLQIFTSGSTGAPSAIPKRLRQLFAEIDALEAAFGERAGEAEIAGLVSHQHIYGLLFRVLWPLATGRVLQAERLPYVETLLQQLASGPRAVGIASPAHLKRLPLQQLDRPSQLALMFSSGGPLPEDALPDCQRVFGQTPIEVYGSSETGGVAWRQRVRAEASWTAEWMALPGIAWRATDAADADEAGEHPPAGLLQVRSAHLPDPAAWHDSADLVRLTPQGFELLGRADRVLKIEGKRVSVLAVEQALLQTGLLAELRVLPLEQGGREQLAVVAQPSEAGWQRLEDQGKAALVDALRQHLAPQVDRIALPRRWRFVSQLPANAQGKATLAALQAQFDPRRPPVRLLKREPGEVLLRLQVEPGLPQFLGHFPGHPILPGVAQLDWVLLFGREWLGLTAPFQGLDGLKFQQVITPGLVVELQLSYRAPQLSFVYRSARGQHASGKVRYGVDA